MSFNKRIFAVGCVITLSHCGTSKFAGSSDSPKAAIAPSPSPIPVPIPPPLQTSAPLPTPKIPDNAITKGSFSAWAIPPNPARRQNYKIYIQVALPSNASSYGLEDLSGNLLGTDTYRQTIGFNPVASSAKSFVTVPILGQGFEYNGSNSALLIVPVPGAESLVRDVVTIHSQLLNESQDLTINFQ